jgi:hypothetical protein
MFESTFSDFLPPGQLENLYFQGFLILYGSGLVRNFREIMQQHRCNFTVTIY